VRKHFLRETLAGVANCLAKQLGLAGEVVVQSAGRHTRALGDSAGRGVRVTLLDYAFNGCIE
jgi:hypothetical protein